MTHHSHIPSFPLNRFVAGFTYYKNYISNHTIDRYLPNGNIEIIINLTDTPKYIYDNDTFTETQVCKKLWISGLRTGFISIPSGIGAEMFIIEFKKGMVYPFLGMPVTVISGQVIEGDLILNHAFTGMRERLLEKQSVMDMFIAAEKILVDQFHNKFAINPFVEFAVNSIIANPAQLSIKNIADKAGYSSKHLIKIFSDHVGVNPKLFLRIIRFQKAIREIEMRGNINWISLADDCGYYDQAHFISNFKEFSGFTPLAYMERRGNTALNYIPVA